MIIQAAKEDLQAVREMWRICFPEEDPAYIDFYFKNIWTPQSCYLSVEDGKIAGSLCRNRHDLMFNSKVLEVSMLTGMAVLPEYRGRGHMHDLMNTVLDAAEHSELMTLIRSEDPGLYEPFGFRSGFERTAYDIRRRDLKRVPTFGCAFDVKALDMLKVYSAYIRRFTGFYTRDLQDFVRYRQEIIASGGKIIGYYNGQDRIDGYAAVTMQGSDLFVDELVYLNSTALIKLLNVCLNERPRVHFHASKAENLSLIVPDAPKKDYSRVMVRINSYELFDKLYGTDAGNARQALACAHKPLNLNESY